LPGNSFTPLKVEHLSKFGIVSDVNGSRVLVSSRVRGTLESGDVFQITPPSEADAIKILLAAAGIADVETARVPDEALEIVRFCSALPLALGTVILSL
jgi:hypothetical protein